MGTLWTELNDKVPEYLNDIIKNFDLTSIKIGELETALVGEDYALIIFIDKFYAEIDYAMRDKNGALIKYHCDNYFAEQFDDDDRQNLIEGGTAKELVINNLIIINQGMCNKWSAVLEGNKNWISDFEKSRWFNIARLNDREIEVLDKLII